MSIDNSPPPSRQSDERIDEEKKFISDHAQEIATCISRTGCNTFAVVASCPKLVGTFTITSRLAVFRNAADGAHDVIFSIIGTSADTERSFRFVGGMSELIAAFGPSHTGLIESNGEYFRQLMDVVNTCLLLRANAMVVGYQLPETAGSGMIVVPIPSSCMSSGLRSMLSTLENPP